MSFPSRKSQDKSRRRAWAKTAGAHRDEEEEEAGAGALASQTT